MQQLNEETQIRKLLLAFAAIAVSPIMRDLGATRAGNPHKIVDRLDDGLKSGYVLISDERNAAKRNSFVPHEIWRSPGDGPHFGDWEISTSPDGSREYQNFQNATPQTLPIDLRREVSEGHTKETEHVLELSASVTASATVTAQYAGAEVSATTSATAGTKDSEKKAESDLEGIESEISPHLNIPPFEQWAVSYQPVIVHAKRTIDGPCIYDFAFTLDFEDWAYDAYSGRLLWGHNRAGKTNFVGGRHGKSRIPFDNIEHFLKFLYGQDYRWARDAHGKPLMADFLKRCSHQSRAAVHWLEDESKRTVTLKDVEHDRSEDAIDVRIETQGSIKPDAPAARPNTPE